MKDTTRNINKWLITITGSQVSSIADFTRQQALNAAAGAALLDRIGPAVLLTPSQSATFGWLISWHLATMASILGSRASWRC